MLKEPNPLLTLSKLSQARMVNSQLKMMLSFGSICQTIILFTQESSHQVTLKSTTITDWLPFKTSNGIFTHHSGLTSLFPKLQLDSVLPHIIQNATQTIESELTVLLEIIISIGITEPYPTSTDGNSVYCQLSIWPIKSSKRTTSCLEEPSITVIKLSWDLKTMDSEPPIHKSQILNPSGIPLLLTMSPKSIETPKLDLNPLWELKILTLEKLKLSLKDKSQNKTSPGKQKSTTSTMLLLSSRELFGDWKTSLLFQ